MAKKPREFRVFEIPSFGDFEFPSQLKQKYLHKWSKSSVRMATLLSEFPIFQDSKRSSFWVSVIPSFWDFESEIRVSEMQRPRFREHSVAALVFLQIILQRTTAWKSSLTLSMLLLVA